MPAPRMSPTMKRRSSFGPRTRFRSGDGPFTSSVSAVLVLLMSPPVQGGQLKASSPGTPRPNLRRARRPSARLAVDGIRARLEPMWRLPEEDLRLGVLRLTHELELGGALGERHPGDAGATQRHHLP